METRKIQKTGGSTYIVSLPKYWVAGAKLKEGDSVSMSVDSGGTLVVDPVTGGKRPAVSIEVFVDEEENSLHFLRRLIGLYVTGYDEIVVRSRGRIPTETRTAVRDFTRRVIGPQIVEESASAITILDVADHSHLDMRKILKRMHLMARSMHGDAIEAMVEGNAELAADVVARDDEVDRLYWFMSKQQGMMMRDPGMVRKVGVSVPEATYYLSASKALERIADHAARIALRAGALAGERLPEKVVAEARAYSATVVSVLDRSVESMLKGDLKVANEVVDEAETLRGRREPFMRLLMDQKGRFAVPLTLIMESLERTALYSADIAEIGINLAGNHAKA
ncbi:MAG: phosphate uptake regulator PhoU [Candidatus Thermoplasmatota archaeon]